MESVIRLAPLQPRGIAGPRILIAERPLDRPPAPQTPAAVEFSVGARVRAEKADPSQPPVLQYLAGFVPERAPLDDATREMSLEAVLVSPIPVRGTPLPFTRQGVPDPFENRRVVQFTHPGEEPGQPAPAKPQVP